MTNTLYMIIAPKRYEITGISHILEKFRPLSPEGICFKTSDKKEVIHIIAVSDLIMPNYSKKANRHLSLYENYFLGMFFEIEKDLHEYNNTFFYNTIYQITEDNYNIYNSNVNRYSHFCFPLGQMEDLVRLEKEQGIAVIEELQLPKVLFNIYHIFEQINKIEAEHGDCSHFILKYSQEMGPLRDCLK